MKSAQYDSYPEIKPPKYKKGDCVKVFDPVPIGYEVPLMSSKLPTYVIPGWLLLTKELQLAETWGVIIDVIDARTSYEKPIRNEKLTENEHGYYWYSQKNAKVYLIFQDSIMLD